MTAAHRSYTVRATTGILGATLAAGAAVFAMRLPSTSTRRVHVYRVQTQFAATVAFTAASQQHFVLDRHNTATHSGGTAYTPLRHAAQGASAVDDIRAATTGALTATSVVYEDTPISLLGMASPAVSTTHTGLPLDLRDDPILLEPGDGLTIRNLVVWPAAGTGILTAQVSWWES